MNRRGFFGTLATVALAAKPLMEFVKQTDERSPIVQMISGPANLTAWERLKFEKLLHYKLELERKMLFGGGGGVSNGRAYLTGLNAVTR